MVFVSFLLMLGIFKLIFDKRIETLGVGRDQMILQSKASRKNDNHQLLCVSLLGSRLLAGRAWVSYTSGTNA